MKESGESRLKSTRGRVHRFEIVSLSRRGNSHPARLILGGEAVSPAHP
jgi:hypothetical protein